MQIAIDDLILQSMFLQVTSLALDYVNNNFLLNDVKSGNSRVDKQNIQICEAFVWGSNSSHQLGEQMQDKVMFCKKSKAFEKAFQVNKL